MVTELSLRKHKPGDHELPLILQLILDNFAYMAPRIDPPSSILQSRVADLARQCEIGELWSIGSPPVACVCLTPLVDSLNLGRLAVDQARRGQGLGKRLVELAQHRAQALGFSSVELQVRVQLTENIDLYRHLGYQVVAEGCHEGYEQATYLAMRKSVGAI